MASAAQAIFAVPNDVALASSSLLLGGQMDAALSLLGQTTETFGLTQAVVITVGLDNLQGVTPNDLVTGYGVVFSLARGGLETDLLEIEVPIIAIGDRVTEVVFTLHMMNAPSQCIVVGANATVTVEVDSTEVVPPSTLWALADHQGTIRDVVEYDTATNATVVRNHITYDAFGQITSQTDADYQPRFTFTSRDFDPETGHYYYRNRYYDAWMGQFLSEDPIGFEAGELNLRTHSWNSAADVVPFAGQDRMPSVMGGCTPRTSEELQFGDDLIAHSLSHCFNEYSSIPSLSNNFADESLPTNGPLFLLPSQCDKLFYTSSLSGCLKSPGILLICLETRVLQWGNLASRYMGKAGGAKLAKQIVKWGGKIIKGGGKGSHIKVQYPSGKINTIPLNPGKGTVIDILKDIFKHWDRAG